MIETQKYKLTVKNGAGWRHHASVRLLISVGQPYHEGEKLTALFDWINRNPSISRVQICVNDYLQRWNYIANGTSPDIAKEQASLAGAEWIARNENLFQTLTCQDIDIIRWATWLNKPLYNEASNALETTLCTTQGRDLAASIKADCEAILTRRKKHFAVTNDQTFLECSSSFIKEELAVIAVQQFEKPMADVYPGSVLQSTKWFQDTAASVPEILLPLKKRYFCRVDFSRVDPIHNAIAALNGLDLRQKEKRYHQNGLQSQSC